MTSPDPVDRLRDAINSHDPRRVADCFTADYRCEVPHRPAESFVGSVLLCGPVVMTTRDGRIAWTRFYVGPITAPAGSPSTEET